MRRFNDGFDMLRVYINLFHIIVWGMSKLLKKDQPSLKFDTSQANINCFIRAKSKPKSPE